MPIENNNENKSFAQLLDDFQNKCDDVLEGYILNGYLRTFAGLLSYMSNDRAQKILLSLDQDSRQKIEYFMNHQICNPKLEAEYAFAVCKFAPLDELAQIEKQRRKEGDTQEAFAAFEAQNPIYAEYLKKMHFGFKEIVFLDDRAIQKILRETDQQVLAKALVNCDEEIRNKIFRNMSLRAANMLKEDMEYMGPVSKAVSFEAQAKIASIAQRLEDFGEIVRNYDEDFEVGHILQHGVGFLGGEE
ncbi:MAG: hypothetical protein J5817_00545 [Treponema sp.]|nr:hypothetical protein [Treponema sp.]